MEKNVKKKKIGWIMVLPSLIIFLALGLFPLIYSAYLSLHSYSLLDVARGFNFVGLNNFIKPFRGAGLLGITFLKSLSITTIFVTVSLALEIGLGLLAAILIGRERARDVRGLKTLLFLPMLLPAVVVGYTWSFLYQRQYGFLNYLLSLVHLPPLRWLTRPSMALGSLIIANVWEWTPFSFLVLLAAILSLPKEYLEAADIDGAGGWQKFIYVVLPGIKRAILIILLIRGIELIKTVDLVYSITYGGPGVTTRTLTFCAYMLGFRHFEIGEAAAYAYLILIPINILVLIFLNVLREKGR